MSSQNKYHHADADAPEIEGTMETDDCPSCQGLMLKVSDEFVCLERCLSCNRSRLLGWFSVSGLLVPGRESTSLRVGEWAGHLAAQGA